MSIARQPVLKADQRPSLPGLDFELSGTDPYDVLRSPRIPRAFRMGRRSRQALVQGRKLVPLDLSGVLGITPYTMAKAVGCALSASARAAVALGSCSDCATRSSVREMVGRLDACGGSIGDGSFGYEFDVQTRWAFYPAGSPNVIATVFVARGLLEAGLAFGNAEWVERALGSCAWIDEHLMVESAPGCHYAYVPSQMTLVHNANLLAALMCSWGARFSGDDSMGERAEKAAETSIRAQRADGSWSYGDGPGLDWTDSFHTAYNIDALCGIWLSRGSESARDAGMHGATHWRRDFFGPDGQAYYYPGKHWPVDIHCAATAVDVDARLATSGLGTGDIARLVHSWTAQNLATGPSAYFRRYRTFTDRRRFPRWGDAHWALARASMMLLHAGRVGPLESSAGESGHW